jgi:hypothetical protein
MLDNVVAFVPGCLYQMLQSSFSRKRFGKQPESRNTNKQAKIPLLGNGSLKVILMSTEIQQKFPWIRGNLGSPGDSSTADTGD